MADMFRNQIGDTIRRRNRAAETRRQEQADQVQAQTAREELDVRRAELYPTSPGTRLYEQTGYERRAGILPPEYEGARDIKTGQLLEPFKTDPYKGEALQALKQQAFASGESPWAALQMQGQKMEEQSQRDRAIKQAGQSQGMAQAQLARSGGLSGGARALLARQGQRDLTSASQDVSRMGSGQRLGIAQQDLARREGLLGKFGDLESKAQEANIGQLSGDILRKAGFEGNRYNEQLRAWAAQQSAAAGKPSGGKK